MRYIIGILLLVAFYYSLPILGSFAEDWDMDYAKEIVACIAFGPVFVLYLTIMFEEDKEKNKTNPEGS